MTASQIELLTSKSDLLKTKLEQASRLKYAINSLKNSGNDSDGYERQSIVKYSVAIIEQLHDINPKHLYRTMIAAANEVLGEINKEIEDTSLLTILSEIEKG